jgi:hypothetical protein
VGHSGFRARPARQPSVVRPPRENQDRWAIGDLILQLLGYSHPAGRGGLAVEDDQIEAALVHQPDDHRAGGHVDIREFRQIRVHPLSERESHLFAGAEVVAVDQDPQGLLRGLDHAPIVRLPAPAEHDVTRDRRIVTHHPDEVAVNTKVAAIDRGRRAQAHATVANGRDLGCQLDRFGGVLDRQLAAQRGGVGVDDFGAGHNDPDVGKALDVKEIGRSQVVVSLANPGLHRCGFDTD